MTEQRDAEGPHVLYCEDEELLATLAARQLLALGHRVTMHGSSPAALGTRSIVVGSTSSPALSSAILRPRRSCAGTPYTIRSPRCTHDGSAPASYRVSPAGVPKKKTSCRVATIRRPITSGKSFPIQGPHAKTKRSAESVREFDMVIPAKRDPVVAPGRANEIRTQGID